MAPRKLEPGQAVRIEVNGHVVKQADKDNPFWYEVSFDEPGRPNEIVSLARINAIQDTIRAVMDTDGSMQLFTPRLSASGALELMQWLRTHQAELEAAVHPPTDDETEQAELVLCQSCKMMVDED